MSIRERADLLIEARWLLPIAPANTALAEHAVAVTAGRIVAVGPAAQLRERFETGERVVRERHALLPGLVNAHTHAWHTLLRGLPVRGPRWRWLSEIMGPVEQRCLSADLVRDGTRLGVAEMLRAGITCFADLSLFPEEAARAAAAAHMRAAIGLPVADAPTPWADSARAPRSERPLRQLHALGLLRPGFSAIGAGSCDGADLELLARHGAGLIACPQAELRLGARSPVAALEGNRTGLGTDSPVAAGALDLLAEARAAALHSGLTAGEVLRMATLGGATVLGLSAQIGSIEPGKAADLVCIDLGALGGQPAAAIADAITFGATRSQVSDVWTGGRLAVSGARLVALDEEELAALPARWAQRVRMEAAA